MSTVYTLRKPDKYPHTFWAWPVRKMTPNSLNKLIHRQTRAPSVRGWNLRQCNNNNRNPTISRQQHLPPSQYGANDRRTSPRLLLLLWVWLFGARNELLELTCGHKGYNLSQPDQLVQQFSVCLCDVILSPFQFLDLFQPRVLVRTTRTPQTLSSRSNHP